jgi:hypothetical protein
MISEPTKGMEKKAFRVPAAVSLPPKRRFRADSATTLEQDDEGESLEPIISPVRRRRKLKRTGRLVLRWVDPKLCPADR